MANKLFLLDGMALVYRAHFAFVNRPIYTSQGVNTSAIYGFTQTLLEIINTQKPTHLAVAFDTDAPTQRHEEYKEYKAQREAMPEELSAAIPNVHRMVEAFNIPVLEADGWEADDIIGTLVKVAEQADFQSFMVTPDKDFSQLVSEKTVLYKPSRMGDAAEILDLPAILSKWSVENPEQIIDILGLWGDASDNIPGVPGIGEKTAVKLIARYGSVENLLAHTDELKGKQKENVVNFREQALLSKRLATILTNAPVPLELDQYKLGDRNDDQLQQLCVEFEFNTIGKRLFGPDFKAGRGYKSPAPAARKQSPKTAPAATPTPPAELKGLDDVKHDYQIASEPAAQRRLLKTLMAKPAVSIAVEGTGEDPKQTRLTGIAFAFEPHGSTYVPLPEERGQAEALLDSFRPFFEKDDLLLIGHELKHDLSVLAWNGLHYGGKLFDTSLVQGLVEPDMRRSLGFVTQVYLGYELLTDRASEPAGSDANAPALSTADLPGLEPAVPIEQRAAETNERADLALQLRSLLEPKLGEKSQEKVFYEIECPLLPVLVDMEREGIRLDAATLEEFGRGLAKEMDALEKSVYILAGREFNLNSPKQLGEVLFDELKLLDKPKKTRTGQYATNEQTLLALAPDHKIVQQLLEYRAAAKLKSTYVDALPLSIWPRTNRIHTTYQQLATSTGRLNSNNPNLQNIPIRTEKGQEIRKAFLPRSEEYSLLSADYSQIELRIIAALSGEEAMLEAFKSDADIHTATAARVYETSQDEVTPEMRRKAKMVNYGIAYGISAFGLAQRLGIPRKEAAEIIEQYFTRFPGVAKYMDDTIAFCREHGYVETITGRRRYLRDINSSNGTIRSAAERNAINAPIQGTAADMIKIAMTRIHQELEARQLKTRMLLQVHDELVFDLFKSEEEIVGPIIDEKMKTAIPLDVPLVIDIGTGATWLEAH